MKNEQNANSEVFDGQWCVYLPFLDSYSILLILPRHLFNLLTDALYPIPPFRLLLSTQLCNPNPIKTQSSQCTELFMDLNSQVSYASRNLA